MKSTGGPYGGIKQNDDNSKYAVNDKGNEIVFMKVHADIAEKHKKNTPHYGPAGREVRDGIIGIFIKKGL